jgi:hypothetical protein
MKKLYKQRDIFEQEEDSDPISSLANLFDISMVFAVALMVALVSFWQMDDMLTKSKTTIIKNPGKENMEIIIKDGKKIDKYKASDVTSEGKGKGKQVGTAYQLENGEIIYVPE